MCRPKGSWFWSSWFRTGYPFQRRFLERGINFRGNFYRKGCQFRVLGGTYPPKKHTSAPPGNSRPKRNWRQCLCKVLRVWKGIFGIRDLTKIRCENRENDKYIDGIRDLTVPWEAGLAKNLARDARFMSACLSGCRKPSRPTGSSGQCESTRRALSGVSFQSKHPMECLVNRS